MTRFVTLAALAVLAGAQVAGAVQTPRPGALDPRIRTVFYNPDQVIALRGYFGFQTMIEFNPDERIENVSIGDGVAWQVTPNKKANLLFLKPMERAPTTNMTVVTDRRRYAFELTSRTSGGERAPDIAYVLRFLYPPERVLPPVTATVAAPPPPPERRNLRYTYTGSRAALPSLVFDDGRFTYFRWPENVSTPALFVIGPDGGESLVNYSVRDGYQVVEQTAQKFILRDGKAVTTVINEGWTEPTPGELAPRPHDAKTAREAAHSGAPR